MYYYEIASIEYIHPVYSAGVQAHDHLIMSRSVLTTRPGVANLLNKWAKC
jgi:hypothetical protein